MRVLVIQSRDSEWDFSDKIKEAVEGRIAPLQLDFKTVNRFYETLLAVDGNYDVNIVLFFPSKKEEAVAGPILLELMKEGAKVIFYFSEDVGIYEDDIVKTVASALGL